MKRALITAVAALVFAGGSALAADLPRKAPITKAPPPAYYNWTGFYIGGHVGYGWGDSDVSIVGLGGPAWNPYFPDPFRPRSFDSNGFIGGGQIGYNFQTGSIVFGAEADISYSNIDGSLA